MFVCDQGKKKNHIKLLVVLAWFIPKSKTRGKCFRAMTLSRNANWGKEEQWRGSEAGKAEGGHKVCFEGGGWEHPRGSYICLRTPHQERGGRRFYPPVPFSHHERFIWQGFRSLHVHSTVGEVLAASHSNPTPQHPHRCPGAAATWSMRQGAVCGDMRLVWVSSVARDGPKLSGDKWRQEIRSGLLNVSDSPTETAH